MRLPGTGSAGAAGSWMERMAAGARDETGNGRKDGAAGRSRGSEHGATPERDVSAETSPRSRALDAASLDLVDEGIEELQRAARSAGRSDGEAGIPEPESEHPSEAETTLRARCRALWERWQTAERRRLRDLLTDREETVSRLLGRAGLLLDRMDRLTNELIRLKARRSTRRQEVTESLESEDGGDSRGLSTKVYVAAIGFLGLVEFFANAPVFSTLLPRDPLTERQIQVVAETSEGWLAGAERVLAQLVLRPDAALLAAGVITFLCVLAHFFGHSLRELVMQKDRESHRDTVTGRSTMENVVPMVLTGLGLALVLGVLFEARVILGDVGERRYQEDMAAVTELRREAGWMRTDGDLLAANDLSNRADDMEAAATRLREYAVSMSRMTWPILLLNLTLVLAAICAAYFHKRTGAREQFNESPYERERRGLIESVESTADEVAEVLSSAVRPIRELRNMAEDGPRGDPDGVADRLSSVISLYRSENARTRGVPPASIAAFRTPARLDLGSENGFGDLSSHVETAREYEEERKRLARKFESVRERFNSHLVSWQAERGDGRDG